MTVPSSHNQNKSPAALRRQQLVEAIGANVPEHLRQLPQWLCWRFIHKGGQGKPSKVPFYANGHPRGWPNGKPRAGADGVSHATDEQPQVEQGHALDRAQLLTYDQVLPHLPRFDGLGFAFLPGDGLIGIDVDGAIDLETGEMSDLCSEIITRAGSYTELSPSKTGVHVIVHGETVTFKDNTVGVEVFCGRQFFTVTGQSVGAPVPVKPIAGEVLSWLREIVKGPAANEPVQVSARASALAAGGVAAVQGDAIRRAQRYCLTVLDAAVSRMVGTMEGGRNDRLNDEVYGLARLIHTGGVSEITVRSAMADAARRTGLPENEIQATINSAIAGGLRSPRAIPDREDRDTILKRDKVRRPEPPPQGELASLSASAEPAANAPLAAAPNGGEGGAGEDDDTEGALDSDDLSAAKRAEKKAFLARVKHLCERFRLIENSDEAWDGLEYQIWKIPHMRVRFGRAIVNTWLHRVAENKASTVKIADLVFEPGLKIADHQVNMFGGLTIEPVECKPDDVAPMLALLRHLCSEASPDADEVDNVVDWVLRWQALPLQHLGTKMQTALVFHGAQGTGKNLYWDIWRDLFGAYGITVGQTELEDKFNGWLSRKLAIIGDEVVSRQEMYHNKNRIKSIVTQEAKFPIRGMQRETRWESNHANVVFLSNESQPLALEERDRRYLVIYTPLEADPAIYEAVRDFKASNGLGKWLYYLQHYDLRGFTAHTKPLMTRAKQDLIELNWRPPERFASEWINGYLDLPLRVCSAEQLYRAFKRWCDMQGERFAPAQITFTKAVERWVKEQRKRDASTGGFPEPLLIYKQISLKEVTQARKTVRCWVPKGCGAPDGQTESDWASASVMSFEDDLRRFRSHQGNQGDMP